MTEHAFVLDASAAVALALSDEDGPSVADIVAQAIDAGRRFLVPPLFWYEVGNSILVAERRGRLDGYGATRVAADLSRLPIDTDWSLADEVRSAIASLAGEHDLTYYDAAYLELALRTRLKLKTLDRHLLSLQGHYESIF
ncbi:MAG: type II toxin-antitoxin system VapC family toxin [Spirochaetales bacterium]|nr:type II toxin-antitoxin system VapC family toxin [Spirochaetales bacterium]